jgi:hypothetical protein
MWFLFSSVIVAILKRSYIFSRFKKLDVLFLAFLHFALIVEALRVV